MSNATDIYEATILNDLISTAYAGLLTAVTDSEAGTVTEVSGGSYARVDLSTLFPTATDGSVSNDSGVTFPPATADWGTVTHVGIYDAATDGTLKMVVALDSSVSIITGRVFSFAEGSLTLEVD